MTRTGRPPVGNEPLSSKTYRVRVTQAQKEALERVDNVSKTIRIALDEFFSTRDDVASKAFQARRRMQDLDEQRAQEASFLSELEATSAYQFTVDEYLEDAVRAAKAQAAGSPDPLSHLTAMREKNHPKFQGLDDEEWDEVLERAGVTA